MVHVHGRSRGENSRRFFGSFVGAPLILQALALALSLATSARPVSAQDVDTRFWGTDNDVTAVARVGNTLFIGGYFKHMGPVSGGCAPVDSRRGVLRRAFPKVAGAVFVIVPDGRGGRYIGGRFVGVGGLPRSNLAHILANGTVAAWAPNPNGTVRAIAVGGRAVYAAGDFTTIGGRDRRFIAALDVFTGEATHWNPNADAPVWSLLVTDRCVYAGGDFTNIGGQPRSCVAALDSRTGAATTWNPSANARVRVLCERGHTILAGGAFDRIGGQPRACLAAINVVTGVATAWDPNPTLPYWVGGLGNPTADVYALLVDGSTIYVGGYFKTIGGQPRGGLAAVDAHTGLATDWNPVPVMDAIHPGGPYTIALQLRGNTLYACGAYVLSGSTFGGESRTCLGAVNTRTGRATEWNPQPNEPPYAMSLERNEVWLGGTFNGFDWQPRACLAALDLTTGAPTDWSPKVEGRAVLAFALSGKTLYLGGSFDTIGGQVRNNLGAIDGMTGAVTRWNPSPSGGHCGTTIWSILPIGDRVYVGGGFSQIGGELHENIAAVDTVTGSAIFGTPGTDDWVWALAARGRNICAAGWFTRIGGLPRNFIAAIDSSTGTVTPWNPNADGIVEALAVSGDTLFVAGDFRNIGGQSRRALAALDANTGSANSWNPSPNEEIRTIAVHGDRVYAGGDFTIIGGEPRYYLASIDRRAGTATAWNAPATSIVRALQVENDVVYVGGRFNSIGPWATGNVAGLSPDVPAGVVVAVGPAPSGGVAALWLAQNAPNPTHSNTVIRFTLPEPTLVSLEVFDVQGRLVATLLNHEPRRTGEHAVQVPTASWHAGVYLYRLRAGHAEVTRRMLVLR